MAPAGEPRATRGPDGRLVWEPRSGDVVVLRAPHACGEVRMLLTLVALDARLACTGCGRHIVLSRQRLSGRVAEVLGVLSDFPEFGQT